GHGLSRRRAGDPGLRCRCYSPPAPRPARSHCPRPPRLRRTAAHPRRRGVAVRRRKPAGLGADPAYHRACRADRAAHRTHRAAADRPRILSAPPHLAVRADLRSFRIGFAVLRTGGFPHQAADQRSLPFRHRGGHLADAADGRDRRSVQPAAVSVLRAYAPRQGAARHFGQSRRRAHCRYPAGEHGDARVPARLAPWRHIGDSDRPGDDALLRLRLHHRPQGFRRRDHRRPRQLSRDGGRRHPGRHSRKLRVVLEQRAQGGGGVQRADPGAAAAFAVAAAGRRRGRGDRGMRAHATRLAAFAVIAALAAAPFWASPFTITLLNYIGIYALVALGVVLLTGVAGLTSFGQAAFVGIGAYATAWLTTAAGASPWFGLAFAFVLTGLVATLLGAVTLRLGGPSLPLGTIAWGLSIYFLFGNMEALRGHNGIAGVPPISIGPLSLERTNAIYYLIWSVLAGATPLIANLLDSRAGRAIRSLRGGVVMVESLGISVFRIRLVTFVIAALLAGLSGWLYAHMERFVSPAPFDVRMGIQYLFMAILGG